MTAELNLPMWTMGCGRIYFFIFSHKEELTGLIKNTHSDVWGFL